MTLFINTGTFIAEYYFWEGGAKADTFAYTSLLPKRNKYNKSD